MGWMRFGAGLVGAWVAYVALFLVGASAFGPTDGGGLTPEEQSSSLAFMGIVAAIDVALFAAWLTRSRDRGWRAWLGAVVVFYGIKTFSSNLEVWWFVRAAHVPPEMLPSLFAMTLPLAIGWTGLAVWLWTPRDAPPDPPLPERSGVDLGWRVLAAGALVYPALFFLAGYYVAWQQPAVRAYYEGPAVALPFGEHLARMFAADPRVLPFEVARGLLWVAIGWPVLRRTRGPWWVGGGLFAVMVAVVQNDVHLLPNPLMPREVRVWHLVETASSNLVFGLATAALLAPRGGFAALVDAARRRWTRPIDARLAGVAAPLELFLAGGGLYGGWALFFDPSGGGLGMSAELLRGSPFPNYEIPGIVLFFANGVLPCLALAALAARSDAAGRWVLASGAALVGWMVAQLAWIGPVFWLQAVLLALGVALVALGAGWTWAERARSEAR